MGDQTLIEWADHTFNPWEGCQKVSPGCDNCYAEARNARWNGGQAPNWGPGAPRRRTSQGNWNKPRQWERQAIAQGRRPFVFCASLADVFDNQVDPAWRADLFQLIRETPHLVWLLLTKRPQLVQRMAEAAGGLPPNVALGTSVVQPDEVDRNCAAILETGGALFYFVSAEPLLADIADQLEPWLTVDDSPYDPEDTRRISWVIVGGESGPNARPMKEAWALRILGSCRKTGAVFNFKQHGGRDSDKGGHLLRGTLYQDRPRLDPPLPLHGAA